MADTNGWMIFVDSVNGLGTVLIAGLILFLTWRQTSIASANREIEEARRRNELFDRRFPLYEMSRKVMSAPAFNNGRVPDDLIERFRSAKLDAAFLYDDEMEEYLSDVIRYAHQVNDVNPNDVDEPENRRHAIDARYEAIQWLNAELQDGKLKQRFRPFLRLE